MVRVTLAEPLVPALAAATAVIVMAPPAGSVAGERYIPDAEIVPRLPFPPGTPLTCQITAVFDRFVTVAENALLTPPTSTLADDGDTVTEGVGALEPTDNVGPPEAPHPASAARNTMMAPRANDFGLSNIASPLVREALGRDAINQ